MTFKEGFGDLLENQTQGPSDAELVQNCQEGNLNDFSLLYERYLKKIYDFVYFKTFHKETAEDISSRVFIKALEGISAFEEREGGGFSSWIYRIARNMVIDHYRTIKTHTNIEDVWDLASRENVQIDTENKDRLEAAKKFLLGMDRSQREIVIMRVWQGMSFKEIAEKSGKNEAHCRTVFSRCLVKIRTAEAIGIALVILVFCLAF
jgi:RNA polymerase sigma-70 factor (ECF subfamily)